MPSGSGSNQKDPHRDCLLKGFGQEPREAMRRFFIVKRAQIQYLLASVPLEQNRTRNDGETSAGAPQHRSGDRYDGQPQE